ncbi:Spy/CpxP family protein refolding chaperone [Piscinibacter sakaiensis]|uniref:Spy/CpxP family protein refolding chaperone n=1 Tax=Piscinibacter sakaiensis TaxID=1547922 RepID=UPI003AAFDB27
MRRHLYAAVTGLMLATSGCSQPNAGMGPGMMGGYGGHGMGPGMMGGYGGQGMGPGMMGGYGMGPGMMWGYRGGAPFVSLDLSAEQRQQIDAILEESAKARWALMGTMHQQEFHMHAPHGATAGDEQAARKAYQAMAEAHKAMFELSLDTRKRIDAVLTREQRDKLRSN